MDRTLLRLRALFTALLVLALARGAWAQLTPGGPSGPTLGPRLQLDPSLLPGGPDLGPVPGTPGTPGTDAGTPGTDAGTPAVPAVCRRVVGVVFDGLVRVSEEDLRNAVHTHEGDCLDRARVSRDAHALWDLGFFRDLTVEANASEGGVEVRFRLSERPSIRAIRYEGFDEVDEDKLRETVDLRDGGVLSESAVRRNVQKIIDLYAEKGYFLAEVTSRIEPVERGENQVDVVFHIVEGVQVQVRSLTFVGNQHLSADELRAAMGTSTASFFSFLTSAGTFREEAFRNDLVLLQAAYYDRGYLTVEIENPRVSLSADRRFIDLSIHVREGSRYRIGRLRVTEVDDDGNEVEPLGGRRALRNRVHLGPGEFFSRTTVARDVHDIETLYRDAGYANVEVDPQIAPQPEGDAVDITVRIQRHQLVYVHRIEVRGNSKTSDRVIRREMELIEGELYSETDYQDSRRRIMALGYFERVDLSTEAVEGHPEWLVVNVEVAERPTGTFQIGAGFSSVENFIATAQIQQLNLFGRGQSLTLQAQLSGLRQIFSLRFVEPYLFDSDWTFALDVYNTLRAFTDFTRTATGGTLTLGYPILGNDLRLFATYTGEFVGVSTRTGTGLFGQNTLPSAFQNLPLRNLFQSGFTSALGAALQYDTRDNRILPTSGVFARLGVDVADPYLLSQNVYTRLSGWFRFYQPIISSVILRFNLQGGVVTSRRDIGVPLFERFFLGGIFDVRGYRLRTISPRLTLNSSTDPNSPLITNGAVIGGNIQLYYNLEVEFPILTAVGIRGVVFTDGGNVFNTEPLYCAAHGYAQSTVIDPCTSFLNNPTALRYSAGFGIRWQSPLGLLRFEWGFPLERLSFEESSVFEFTIGNFF